MTCAFRPSQIPWLWLPLLVVATHGSTVKRIETDLLRMIDGTFAPATVKSTITFDNDTATVVFSGDAASGEIEALYILFADASHMITEIQLDKAGSSKISSYSAPHVPTESPNGAVSFVLGDNGHWNGNATIHIPSNQKEIVKYAMAAKLPGDAGSSASYMCTYSLSNAAVSIPDLQIPALYDAV